LEKQYGQYIALLGSLLTGMLMGCDNAPLASSNTPYTAEPDAVFHAVAPLPAPPAEAARLAVAAAEDPPAMDGGLKTQSTAFAATSCSIAFADYIGLLILPDRAGHTFASSPYYIQGCGSGWVHVKENDVARYGSSWGSSYNHYHLMYEKGAYCITGNGGWGYLSGNSCIAIADPALEPRYLASHYGNQWIRIYVYKSGVPEMTFDFKSIRVKGTQGIKLWFRKADGSWWYWSNLGPGTWNVAPYAAGIREILIRASNNSTSSYSFDDVVVGVI
jgi:hypothetical protein